MRKRLEGAPHRYHEDHIAAEGINSLSRDNLVHKFIPICKGSSGKIIGKTWENTIKADDKSQKQKRGDRRSEEPMQKSSCCVIDGSLSSQEFGVRASISKVQRQWHNERWFRIIRSIYWTRIISITDDSRKSHGHYFKTTRMRRTRSRCSIRWNPSQNVRCTDVNGNSKVRMSRYLDTSTETKMAQIMVQYVRPNCSSCEKSVRSSFGRTVVGTAVRAISMKVRLGKRFPIGNAYSYTVKKGYSFLCMWMTSNWLERNKTLIWLGKSLWNTLIWENQHHSSTMFIWVAHK